MIRCALFVLLLLSFTSTDAMQLPPLNWLPCAPNVGLLQPAGQTAGGQEEPVIGLLDRMLLGSIAAWCGKTELLLRALPARREEDSAVELTPRERAHAVYLVQGAVAELAEVSAQAQKEEAEFPLRELLRGWGLYGASARLAQRLRVTQCNLCRMERILHFAKEQQFSLDDQTLALARRAGQDVARDRASHQAVLWAIERFTQGSSGATVAAVDGSGKQSET